jgi:hydrogenase maturation protease
MQDLNNGERSLYLSNSSVPPPTLVIGLGNPILGDDGVGWHIAKSVAQKYVQSLADCKRKGYKTDLSVQNGIEVDYLAVGGLSLMERLVGYDRAIIIDAIQTNRIPIGEVICTSLDELPETTGHLTSTHDTSLQKALKVGCSMGAHLPKEIIIVGIEAESVYDFSEELSAPVAAALPKAINLVMELIK